MAAGPALSLRLQSLQFPGASRPLFGPLRLDIAPGEVVGLIGPSGVGKTTLLRLVAGLEDGFQGHVSIGGRPAAQAPAPGFVFQDARLLPWLDAAANIRAVRPEVTQAQIDLLLGRVGLAGQSRAFPRQLSGGMQRRLALARALAAGSGLLLLDEPFVSLDRTMVQDLRKLLQEIFAAEQPTVLLVSHDPEDAVQLAGRVVMLSGHPAQITADFRLPSEADAALAMIRLAMDGTAQASDGQGPSV